MYFYLFFLFLSVVVTVKIYRIQNSWEPNEKFVKEFLPSKHLEQIRPREGSIMDHNGRILAISTPLYDIYMDCYVQKEHYDKDEKNENNENNETTDNYGSKNWFHSWIHVYGHVGSGKHHPIRNFQFLPTVS